MKKKMTKTLALVLCMIMVFTVAGPLCVSASELSTTEATSTAETSGGTEEATTKVEEATTIYKPETTITTDTKTDVDEEGNTTTTTTTVESGKDDKASYDSTTVETKTENADGSKELTGSEKGEQYSKDEFYQGEISTGDKTMAEWDKELSNSYDELDRFYPDGITEKETTEVSGDIKEDENDTEYDQTTTVTENRELGLGFIEGETVDNSETEISSINPSYPNASELEIGTGDDYNYDHSDSSKPQPNIPDAYDYYYSGHAAEPENNLYTVVYTDKKGKTKEVNTTQFVLTSSDGSSKNVAYCCDFNTSAKLGKWYTIDNIEDAGYYTTDGSEENIKYLVINGYWGTDSGMGSLEHFKNNLKQRIAYDTAMNTNKLSPQAIRKREALDTVIDNLTDAQAMAITQAAIWAYGKRTDEYTFKEFKDDIILDVGKVLDSYPTGNDYITVLKDLLDVFLNYDNNDSVSIPTSEFNATKVFDADSINKIGFTVKEKDAGFSKFYDTDIYKCDIGLVLNVDFTSTNKLEIVLRSYINGVSGDYIERYYELLPNGATATKLNQITPDENGKYVLPVSLSEHVKLDIELKGTQSLKDGVYIFTSHGGTDKSQTFVSVGEGVRKIDVKKSLNIFLEVNEATKTTSREWSKVWAESVPAPVAPPEEVPPVEEPKEDPKPEPPVENPPAEEPEDDIPVEVPVLDPEPEVVTPEVPTPEKITEVKKEVVKTNTAKAPKTGDESHVVFYLAVALSAVFAGAIIVYTEYMSNKRKDRK